MMHSATEAPLLFVLEGGVVGATGEWLTDAVRSAFDFWSHLLYGHNHGYRHAVFYDAESLTEIIARKARCGRSRCRYLYIAADDDQHELYPHPAAGSGGIDIAALRDVVHLLNGQEYAWIHGVHLGACSFLTPENAQLLLCSTIPQDKSSGNVCWVAGYSEAVEWIDVCLIDLYFLRHLCCLDAAEEEATRIRGRAGGPLIAPNSEPSRRQAARLVQTEFRLARKYGFQVYERRWVKGCYEVIPLIAWD